MADFCLVSRRALSEFEHKLFRFHFLLGADWKLCARRLGVDRGNFFHGVYRIQAKLGRAYRDTEPYALFPVDEYFHGPSKIDLAIVRSRPAPARPADRVLPFPMPERRTA